MRRLQLKALLECSPPSIVFDARGGEFKSIPDGAEGASDAPLPPFFDHTLLRNAILFKTVQAAAPGGSISSNQMRFFFPFDPKSPANGGAALVCGPDFTLKTLEKFSGATLDPAKLQDDLRKIAVLTTLPSFSPFLMRDAFDRAGVKVDLRHFCISREDVATTRDTLKAKLKPLAAMALSRSAGDVADAALETLAHKLWDLDDEGFLNQFGRALKLRDGEAAGTIRAWLGVAYFQREFSDRQPKLRAVAQWVPEGGGESADQLRDVDLDRKLVRESLRQAWVDATAAFKAHGAAYDALINKSDSGPFIEYLKFARRDFLALGGRLAVIDQSICTYDAAERYGLSSRPAMELLQDLAGCMRDGIEGKTLVAA